MAFITEFNILLPLFRSPLMIHLLMNVSVKKIF